VVSHSEEVERTGKAANRSRQNGRLVVTPGTLLLVAKKSKSGCRQVHAEAAVGIVGTAGAMTWTVRYGYRAVSDSPPVKLAEFDSFYSAALLSLPLSLISHA